MILNPASVAASPSGVTLRGPALPAHLRDPGERRNQVNGPMSEGLEAQVPGMKVLRREAIIIV